MNKTVITIIALITAGLLGLMWWGSTYQATPPDKNQLATKGQFIASETFYDFGTISMASGKVHKIFKITNPTDKDITIESVTTSCMCTSAFIVNGESRLGPFGMPGHGFVPKANEVIKARETRDIDVVYDPAAHGPSGVGAVNRFVYLTDATGATLQFEIKANVTP